MTPEFSRPCRVAEIGSGGRRHDIAATDDERAALAARFGLLMLDDLTASLDVRREAAGIRVAGSVSARGSQPCVATADPVPFLIAENLSLLFTESQPEGSEIELSDDDFDVEPLAGDTIDLGEIAAQAFGLALDPYPRSASPAPGVISEAEARAAASPFAALKRP